MLARSTFTTDVISEIGQRIQVGRARERRRPFGNLPVRERGREGQRSTLRGGQQFRHEQPSLLGRRKGRHPQQMIPGGGRLAPRRKVAALYWNVKFAC